MMQVSAMFSGLKAYFAPTAQLVLELGGAPTLATFAPPGRATNGTWAPPPVLAGFGDEIDIEIDRAPLWLLKMEMTRALDHCPDAVREQISAQIAICRTGAELWAVRSGLFRALAVVTNEDHARASVNNFLPFFVNWIPDRHRVAM